MIFPMNGTLQKRVLETISPAFDDSAGRSRWRGCFGRSRFGGFASPACRVTERDSGSAFSSCIFTISFAARKPMKTSVSSGELAAKFNFEFVGDRADVAGEARRNRLESRRRRAASALQVFCFGCGGTRTESRGRGAYGGRPGRDGAGSSVARHGPCGTRRNLSRGGLDHSSTARNRTRRTSRLSFRAGPILARGCHQSGHFPHARANSPSTYSAARAGISIRPACTRLARLANLAREEETFWRALEDDRFATLASREASGAISLGIADLLSPFPLLAARRRWRGSQRPMPSLIHGCPDPTTRAANLCRIAWQPPATDRAARSGRVRIWPQNPQAARASSFRESVCNADFDRLIFSAASATLETEKDCRKYSSEHDDSNMRFRCRDHRKTPVLSCRKSGAGLI